MNIYNYLDSKTLLKDKFKEKKEKNPSFSIRAWAKQLSLKSHGPLQQILAGKRTLPKKYLRQIAKSLELNNIEIQYLESIIDFEKAKSDEEKDYYYKKLNSIRPNNENIQILEIENYKYFQNPLHSIIRTLIKRSDFKNDPVWIKHQLRFKTTISEIKETIQRLIDLGFIREEEGKLKNQYNAIRNVIDTPSKAVQEFHKKMSHIAADEVSKQSTDAREYSSYSFNIKKNEFENAQRKLRQIMNEFIQEFGAKDNESNETYHLNTQLFSLTRSGESNETINH